MSYWGFKPYVSAAQRKAKAARQVAKLAKSGRKCCPVEIEGRCIAKTFWGKAWCDNLESYSDFSNRLPRGRTYVNNGSVVDLQIEPGKVIAMVSGSEIYDIEIKIEPLAPKIWNAIKARCAGQIASIVELLQGRLSKGVMEIITGRDGGMFPAPDEISLDCSCPDWADMCKHVAAALYGVGARLDREPELLFTLRQVDHLELVEQAGNVSALPAGASRSRNTIAAGELADVFGIEIAGPAPSQEARKIADPDSPRAGKKRGAGSAARQKLNGAGGKKPSRRVKAGIDAGPPLAASRSRRQPDSRSRKRRKATHQPL
jgi:uncharacterized Zn finger protein